MSTARACDVLRLAAVLFLHVTIQGKIRCPDIPIDAVIPDDRLKECTTHGWVCHIEGVKSDATTKQSLESPAGGIWCDYAVPPACYVCESGHSIYVCFDYRWGPQTEEDKATCSCWCDTTNCDLDAVESPAEITIVPSSDEDNGSGYCNKPLCELMTRGRLGVRVSYVGTRSVECVGEYCYTPGHRAGDQLPSGVYYDRQEVYACNWDVGIENVVVLGGAEID
jgi:hypothetical protein